MDSDRRDPSGLVTRGVIAIVTAVVLIFLLVYATNRDVLHIRRGAEETVTDDAAGTVTIAADERQTEFGVQIGNNLKAFVTDEGFFDDTEQEPQTPYTESDVTHISLSVSGEANGDMVVRIVDTDEEVVSGEMFAISVVRRIGDRNGGEMVYVDDDMDGVIRVHGLSAGHFIVTLREQEGYHIPQEPSEIELGAPEEEDAEDEAPNGEHDGDTEDGENTETGDNGGTD